MVHHNETQCIVHVYSLTYFPSAIVLGRLYQRERMVGDIRDEIY